MRQKTVAQLSAVVVHSARYIHGQNFLQTQCDKDAQLKKDWRNLQENKLPLREMSPRDRRLINTVFQLMPWCLEVAETRDSGSVKAQDCGEHNLSHEECLVSDEDKNVGYLRITGNDCIEGSVEISRDAWVEPLDLVGDYCYRIKKDAECPNWTPASEIFPTLNWWIEDEILFVRPNNQQKIWSPGDVGTLGEPPKIMKNQHLFEEVWHHMGWWFQDKTTGELTLGYGPWKPGPKADWCPTSIIMADGVFYKQVRDQKSNPPSEQSSSQDSSEEDGTVETNESLNKGGDHMIYFVSRHAGAKEWAKRRGYQVDQQIEHFDANIVQEGDVVIGTLPIHLAAEVNKRGGKYLNLSMMVPAEKRGQEITADEMEEFGAKLIEYQITVV